MWEEPKVIKILWINKISEEINVLLAVWGYQGLHLCGFGFNPGNTGGQFLIMQVIRGFMGTSLFRQERH